jgi:hypothetical protein
MVQTGQDRAASAAPIAGGYVLASSASLMATWRACQSKPLGIGDFRAWLACREMVARRCAVGPDRGFEFGFDELARLLGVTRKRARASVKRLVAAGLLDWSERAIAFPEPPIPVDPALEDSIGGGRGAVAIPRRLLRFLAQGAGSALIAVALAVLFRCLSHRRGGFNGWGRVKASWVAKAFGVSLRQAKAARMQLVELGWIEPEEADQWALNRWGRVYRINLDWSPPRPEGSNVAGQPVEPPCPPSAPAGGSTLTPPPADSSPSLTPPDLQTQIPFGREKNQEPAGGPSGFSVQGSRDGDKKLPSPTFGDVRIEDLKDTGRLMDLLDQAIDRKFVGPSEADRLKFVATAEHALAIGKENPPGLFAYLVRGACWRYVTQADEDRANARIKAYLRGPELVPLTRSSAIRPSLSEDARAVREYRRAFAAARYPGDPFPQIRRHDPSWTRERWDAALRELALDEAAR